jgi:hypothetical protein
MKHPAQEPNVVPASFISIVLGAVVATIVLSLVIMHGIESWRTRDASAPAEQMQGVPHVVNAMETMPFSEVAQGSADNDAADQVLAGYSWVDRSHGIIRVPIDVGFELYLAHPPGSSAPIATRKAP